MRDWRKHHSQHIKRLADLHRLGSAEMLDDARLKRLDRFLASTVIFNRYLDRFGHPRSRRNRSFHERPFDQRNLRL